MTFENILWYILWLTALACVGLWKVPIASGEQLAADPLEGEPNNRLDNTYQRDPSSGPLD